MKLLVLLIPLLLVLQVEPCAAQTQTQTSAAPKKSTPPREAKAAERKLGTSYSMLKPAQKRLVDDYIHHYNETTASKLVPEQAYDNARLSIRTTFDGITHALLKTKLTDASGQTLGHAIDLVDAVDEVMGEESGVGGDRQFRMYVYLKSNAVDLLNKSQEFLHDRDNTIYHKGFPICYRLKHGPPSIQFSISRDKRMSDIDVDYRAEGFPQALYNGHLTAANSDVRAGNNLEQHDNRWAGLSGWWRQVFGQLGTATKAPKENATESLGHIPLNPSVRADKGVDESAHDFMKSWVVDRRPNLSAAYLSRRSYRCLEEIAQKNKKPMPPGMVRLRATMGMQEFLDRKGEVNSVADVFEPAPKWSNLKEAKNTYASEFRLVSMPEDMGQDAQCVVASGDDLRKPQKEKYYATAFLIKNEGSHDQVMSLLWAQEGGYWKIIAVRLEDSSDAKILPKTSKVEVPEEGQPKPITADPAMVNAVTTFYQSWIAKRDAARAAKFASSQSYACLKAPPAEQRKLKPAARIQDGLERGLTRVEEKPNLFDMMSPVQPVDELVRPVDQDNANSFAIMAVPDQMANSFLCRNRGVREATSELRPADAKYGNFYLSASRLKYGDEESPALLLLWSKEKSDWKVVAWAVEIP